MTSSRVARRPVRAVLVSRIYAPEPAAASFRLTALVRSLRGSGAEPTVLTVRPPAGLEPSDEDGTDVRRAPVLRDQDGYVRGYACYLSFDVPALFRLLTVRRPDVVVVEPPPTTGMVARVVCAVRRVPYVYYAADVWSDATASTGAPRVVQGAVRAMEAFAFRGAARVLAVSDGVAERVAALGGRDVAVVRNGIDTSTFRPRATHDEETADRPTLVYAGTASEWQGASIFLAAFRRVLDAEPRARLVFLGQGSEWDEIRRLAATFPSGAVELRGSVPPDDAAAELGAARAGLVSLRPGLGYDFAFPTKVFASLACGTPVVFAGPGPAHEAVRDEDLGWSTAYVVDEVAEAMIAALERAPSPERRDHLTAWVRENASAEATGRRAAQLVLDVVAG